MDNHQGILIRQAEEFVKQVFSTHVNPSFSYHNISHTVAVVHASTLMADHYQLASDDRTALLIAAWFHDTGYSKGKSEGHEHESELIATDFLRSHQASSLIISKVEGCIRATRMPQTPLNLIEQIICDADLFHLGTEDFDKESKLLRNEIIAVTGKDLSKKEWRRINIKFLQHHRYFTDYCREGLEPVKQLHLATLLAREGKNGAPKLPGAPARKPATEQADEKQKKGKENEKENRTERTIGTMFRIVSNSHVNLSHMADTKANIMISVNTIVLSIMVSVLLNKLQFYPQYIIPSVLLTAVCLAAIVFAILATRPTVNRGVFSQEDIQQKKVNLLFFGNFYNMELPDYEWAMREMMGDAEYLYSSMIKDIYYLGKVLARKYKFLRLSYNVFMIGIVVAMAAFGVAFFISGY